MWETNKHDKHIKQYDGWAICGRMYVLLIGSLTLETKQRFYGYSWSGCLLYIGPHVHCGNCAKEAPRSSRYFVAISCRAGYHAFLLVTWIIYSYLHDVRWLTDFMSGLIMLVCVIFPSVINSGVHLWVSRSFQVVFSWLAWCSCPNLFVGWLWSNAPSYGVFHHGI